VKLRSASTWAELHTLEGFSSEQLPEAAMLQGIVVGQYEMVPASDLRPCGIANCSRPHRHGFIIELADGRLSHVGRDCGRQKFGARWNQMVKRYRAARKAQSARDASERVRAEARDVLASADSRPAQLTRAREQLAAFNALPAAIRDDVVRRAQQMTGERIVQYREPTREEVNQAKFHHQRIPTRTEHTVGVIRAIKAVAPNSRADVTADGRLPQQMRELKALVDDPTAASDAISAKMRAIRDTRDLLDRAIERAHEFFVDENLTVLRFLDPSGRTQRITVDEGPPLRLIVHT
jgi:hypothetical protein